MAAAATDKFKKVGRSTATTLSSPGYTIGGTSINVASTTNWPTDTGVTFAVDEVDADGLRVSGTYNVFEGTVNGATQITNVGYVDGDANRNYSAGATTRVYILITAENHNDMVDGLVAEHNQDGTHSDITATTATVGDLTITGDLTVGTVGDNGWVTTGGTHSVATTYNAGNRSFTIDTSTDISGIVSEGMRYRVARGTTPPTQCADLEASSSQYASKTSPTGITFTDDFTCEAWIKLESYPASGQTYEIVSRYTTTGWMLRINDSGNLQILGTAASTDILASYQSIPLDKWVHVAANLDMSGSTGVLYIDGVTVPSIYTNGAATSLTQAGNLAVGARGTPANYFDGKLADVRVWSDIRTATEIKDNMYNYPSDTTGLVAHFKLNGDFNDSSANANNLTASGGALATNVDNPWNATEYGIITAVSASNIQVQCPEGYGIPNETLTAPFYSTQAVPFGFPRGSNRWSIETISRSDSTQAASSATTWYNVDSLKLTFPVGAWEYGYEAPVRGSDGTSGPSICTTLSTANNTESHSNMTSQFRASAPNNVSRWGLNTRTGYTEVSAATDYYLNHRTNNGVTTTTIYLQGTSTGDIIIRATCAYL